MNVLRASYIGIIACLATSLCSAVGIPSIESSAEFDKAISDNALVVIDFWMPKCTPCIGIAPKLEALAQMLQEVKFFKVNVKQLGTIATRFDITSVPNLVFFKNGVAVGSHRGNSGSTGDLKRIIEHALGI